MDASPPRAVFCLKSGMHRIQTVRPKAGQRFYGEPGTVLNGSRIISTFSRKGPYWVASGPKLPQPGRGYCLKEAPACDRPEMLFIDGKPLSRALQLKQLMPGHFYFDPATALVHLADNPDGHLVEAAAALFAFGGDAPDVKITGIVVEKYANPAQRGAIDATEARGWRIIHCEIRLNGGAGVSVGPAMTIAGCDIHHNGQIGITGVGDGVRIEENRIRSNNTRGFLRGWEAGGAKISLSDRVTFRANHVQDNLGPGLWCDGDCRNTIYESNVVEGNQDAGIHHEISYNAIIRNNVLRHNGSGGDGWFWGNDILIAASSGVEVYNNRLTVSPGRCGIMLIDQGRRDDGLLYRTRNNSIYSNDIRFEGEPCLGGTTDLSPDHENFRTITDGNNRFDGNTYRVRQDARTFRFVWGDKEDLDWHGFQSAGQERKGRMVRY